MRGRTVLASRVPPVAEANAVVVVAASIIDFRCANVQRETDVPLKIPSFLPYVCASMLFPAVKRTLDTGARLDVREKSKQQQHKHVRKSGWKNVIK